MQKRTVKDMEFDYNIAKEQLAIKEKLIQVGGVWLQYSQGTISNKGETDSGRWSLTTI